ncbi:MAG TPA: hypothetical protein VLK33_18340 [Terriglobales bacterium]|nr:hypothetical protein [Terriglobales bacterium]
MTSKFRLLAVVSILAFATIACFATDMVGNSVSNAVGNAIGGDTVFTSQGSLWADVPQMDGFVRSDLDIPLFGKLLLQTMMSQYLAEGKGNADWVAFSTQLGVADIKDFYTNARMTLTGWEQSDQETCFSGSDQGVAQVGLFCVFYKNENNENVGLMLIATPDEDNSGKNNVFFVRIENQATPEP